MFSENQIVTVEIVDLGHKGEAIGKADGFTVFVDGALKGDTAKVKIVKVKKNYAVGELIETFSCREGKKEYIFHEAEIAKLELNGGG